MVFRKYSYGTKSLTESVQFDLLAWNLYHNLFHKLISAPIKFTLNFKEMTKKMSSYFGTVSILILHAIFGYSLFFSLSVNQQLGVRVEGRARKVKSLLTQSSWRACLMWKNTRPRWIEWWTDWRRNTFTRWLSALHRVRYYMEKKIWYKKYANNHIMPK